MLVVEIDDSFFLDDESLYINTLYVVRKALPACGSAVCKIFGGPQRSVVAHHQWFLPGSCGNIFHLARSGRGLPGERRAVC